MPVIIGIKLPRVNEAVKQHRKLTWYGFREQILDMKYL